MSAEIKYPENQKIFLQGRLKKSRFHPAENPFPCTGKWDFAGVLMM